MRRRPLGAILVVTLGTLVSAGQRPMVLRSTTIVTRARVILAVDRMLYDRWYPRESIPPPPTHPDDKSTLDAALVSADEDIRGTAIRLLGRLENPADIAVLVRFLDERNPALRQIAVDAIGQAVGRATPTQTKSAAQLLLARIPSERDGRTVDEILKTIGQLKYDEDGSIEIQKKLVSLTSLDPTGLPADRRSLAVATALTAIVHHNPSQLTADTKNILLALARPRTRAEPVSSALEALLDAGAGTQLVATNAAQFKCFQGSDDPREILPRCDSTSGAEVRQLGIHMLDPSDPSSILLLQQALSDRADPRIPAEAMKKLLSTNPDAVDCADLLETLQSQQSLDPNNVFTLIDAIDLASPKCSQAKDLATALKSLATLLGDLDWINRWHAPVHALLKRTAFAPDDAKELVGQVAATHAAWQVRVAAVDTSQLTRDEARIVELADDTEPNVRSEAISALVRLRSPEATRLALKALESDDLQLIIVAGVALKGSKPADRPSAIAALVKTFDRLTHDAKDASRTARLEILQRLIEFAPPDATGISMVQGYVLNLENSLRDFDPFVASAVADLIGTVSGTRPQPKPTYRPPNQPTEAEIEEVRGLSMAFSGRSPRGGPSTTMPVGHAIIQLSTDASIVLQFAIDDAPVAIARLLKLARAGYYNGTMIYRATRDGWVAFGSPGANDYSGTPSFWRDEITATSSQEMAIGLLEQTRDMADGRLFVVRRGLQAQDFTVLGRLVGAAPTLLQMLEGTKVVRFSVPPSRVVR